MPLDTAFLEVDTMQERPEPITLNASSCRCQHRVSEMAKTTTTEFASDTDLMFRAFSDRTRLRILHVLLGGELCVGDWTGRAGAWSITLPAGGVP